MFNVLHVMYGADAGGISSVILNYYRHLVEHGFHFDLALTSDQIGLNAKRFRELGSHIYRLPSKSEGIGAYETALANLLKDNSYDAVHVHENETSYVALRVARKCGVPVRIAHSHTTSPCYSFRDHLRRVSGCVLNGHYATCLISCGKLAGERVFGKWRWRMGKVQFLPNAIDTGSYTFDPSVRRAVRQELGFNEEFVVGMVGRLSKQKNYPLALKIASTFDKNCNVRFVAAGNGELESEISSAIEACGCGDRFKLLGRRSDTARLYQAFDAFMLTSLYEGFPVVGVEASASGLPLLVSQTITPELKKCGEVSYLPLDRPDLWVDEIKRLSMISHDLPRTNRAKAAGFDLEDCWRILAGIYCGELNV